MKISGFTLLRNGIEFDYPFRESIGSLLPLVDELIINVGKGTDSSLEEIKKLQSGPQGNKIQIFESHWPLDDPEKKRGGQILAEQSNLALDRCTGDWCVYLQADEVLHEDDLADLRTLMQHYQDDPQVDGILFNYRHFYGSYDVVQQTRSAYRREVRIIKRSSGARSVGDAQSFLLPGREKPKVVHSQARIFHYGWVRSPAAMKEKTYFMDQLYHGDPSQQQAVSRTPHSGDNYRYKKFWGLKRFHETHPAVMKARIAEKNWNWDLEASPLHWRLKDVKKIVLDSFEKMTGTRLFEYRSYRIVHPRS